MWDEARDVTDILRKLRFVKVLITTISTMKNELEAAG